MIDDFELTVFPHLMNLSLDNVNHSATYLKIGKEIPPNIGFVT